MYERGVPRRTAYLTILAIVACAATLVARWVRSRYLGDIPHVQDEFIYLLQAKTLAIGRLAMPPLSPAGPFGMWFLEDRGRRFGIFPPGWPALLAPGVALRITDWVNPLLHGATVLVLARASRKMLGAKGALCAAAFYAFSPQTLLLAASLMSHTAIALAGAALLSVLARPSPSLRVGSATAPGAAATTPFDALLAGALACVAVLTRPLCAVALAAVFGVGVLLLRRPARALQWGTIAIVGSGFALGTMLLCAYNRAQTGDPLIFPQTRYFDTHLPPAAIPIFNFHPGCNALGFGEGHGCDYSIADSKHTLVNALQNTWDNLRAWGLLLGAGPILPVLALYAFARRTGKTHSVLLAAPILTAGLYGLYWYAGTCYGARFFHAAVPFVVVAAASGVMAIPPLARSPRLIAALVTTVLALDGGILRAASSELEGGYWGADGRFAALKARWKDAPALVMVGFAADVPETPPGERLFWTTQLVWSGFWAPSVTANSAVGLNAPRVDDEVVVYARFHPALVKVLRDRFPDRKLWLYVASERPGGDRVEPWDERLLPDANRHESTSPPDNYDGFRIDIHGRGFVGSPDL
jgi:hypothetical protein